MNLDAERDRLLALADSYDSITYGPLLYDAVRDMAALIRAQDEDSALLRHACERLSQDYALADAQCVAQAAEIERLRADAERYRWLLTQTHDDALVVVGKNRIFKPGSDTVSSINDYIDAAIAAERKEDR